MPWSIGCVLVCVLYFFFFSVHPVLAVEEKTRFLCPEILLIGEIDPDLTEVEKLLVCGDPKKNPAYPNEGWRNIPFSQAKFNLTNFLQERGYHHPLFFPKMGQQPARVEVGERTYVSRVSVEGAEDLVQIDRKRKVLGQPLTPSILGVLETWVSEQVQRKGYACPKVGSLANVDTGVVQVQVIPGPFQRFVSVTTEPIEGANSAVLRRYYAFELGMPFDGRLLTITDNRITSIGLVESVRFTSTCADDGVHLKHIVISGPPRLLRGGFGLNTEGYILGRLSWRNTRLGDFASFFELSAFASARIQTLQSTLNWYFLPYVSRYSLSPSLQLIHRDEAQYEMISGKGQAGISGSLDRGDVGMNFFLGPTLSFYRTLRGQGAPTSRLLSLENRMNLTSHAYEYYSTNPRKGFNANWILDLNHGDLYSEVSAQRIHLDGQVLWNVKDYDPPLWIIGLRGGVETILTSERPGPGTRLPAVFFQYLGGSANLRGFGRQELPQVPRSPGLTSAFLGVEVRLSNTLPLSLDPFVFSDFGMIGSGPLSLDSPLYWSPGIGVRWASPVGPIRTTLAHGYSNMVPGHWQYYFSFGEEF